MAAHFTPPVDSAALAACVASLARWRDGCLAVPSRANTPSSMCGTDDDDDFRGAGRSGRGGQGSSSSSASTTSSSSSGGDIVLSELEHAWAGPRTLRRYAIARGCDADKAQAMLRATLLWRRTAVEMPLGCSTCARDPSAHCFVPLGLSDEGTATVYINPARAHAPVVEDAIQHVVHTLETCFGHARSNNTWIVVLDFAGFGFSHAMQVRLGVHFAGYFSSHLPETLRFFLLVNCPTLFDMLRRLVEPFADARTMAKVKSISGDAEAIREQVLAFGVPPRQALWVRDVLLSEARPGNLPPLPPGAGALNLSSLPEAAE